ncbi:transmembrane protein 160 [Apteryx mantelli]|uniref:Transmembrane protein 160 n=1 Tax=Apteryx mantelli TaxID=2696672 RepID=A0ABM4FZW4_9AVES
MAWWGRAVGRAAAGLLRGAAGQRPGRGPRYSLGRGSAPPPPAATELEKADAWLLRKAHEGGFLSWFRNGLLATGIGVIAYVQSDTGRDAAYGFFLLGGACVAQGSASSLLSLLRLRRAMMLPAAAAAARALALALPALLWLCALSLYVGRLEVELVTDERPDGRPGQ